MAKRTLNCYPTGMDQTQPVSGQGSTAPVTQGYEPPHFEVISLDCEISSYAPDDGGETPLF